MTFLCLLLTEAGPIMHQLTCTSQLVHNLLLCMVVIAKLKAVRKVPAFPPSGKFGDPPHGHQVYETLRGRLCTL